VLPPSVRNRTLRTDSFGSAGDFLASSIRKTLNSTQQRPRAATTELR